MNQQNNLISAARFLELLADSDAFNRIHREPVAVTNDVRINGEEIDLTSGQGEKKLQPISLDNFTFMGSVTIKNFDALSFHSDNANFLRGLEITGCKGSWISIRGGSLERFDGFRNQFEVLSLKNIQGLPTDSPKFQQHPVIELSGFELSKKLVLENVKARELQLVCHTGALFKTVSAEVDDPLWALQLRLAGIPVYVSSEVAKKMLAQGSFAERMGAAA